MTKLAHTILILLHVTLLSITAWLPGCGGSSTKNPAQESTEIDETLAEEAPQAQSLNINVEVSQTAVRPGETVQMTATVEPIRGTRILFNWINATGYGVLPPVNQNSVTWTAPTTLEVVEVRVEVIQLVVTAISQVVSVKESGVETDTEILTANKTILLTVTNWPEGDR
ncbi:MAG: hypothetical protein O7E52_15275 [Candidatus Poribacteria bacterium]|nr:hypothetical protein [Candidatus Poribacteria bacterium]